MNERSCFNDTFDNLSFTESGKILSQTKCLSKRLLCPVRSQKSHFTVDENTIATLSCTQPYKNTADDNISVDDSMFFSNSLDENDSLGQSASLEIVTEPAVTIDDSLLTVSPNLDNKFKESLQNNEEPLLGSCISSSFNGQSNNQNSSWYDKCDLAFWGLPDAVLQKYRNRGISSMFPWQAECLNNPKLLEHSVNLVYSAPTSAGKTLVAEILAIKTVLERRKKVLMVLPFISVVREKMFYFRDILESNGVRVEGFMGSYNPPGGFSAVQVAICTIEKANGIINRLLEDGALDDIGTVIIDEIHLLGDASRGYLLELMLTKLQYMTLKYDNILIQIIGMSATLPNLDLLGKWLKAELYVTSFRPIPLHEKCLINGEIYNKNLILERRLLNLPELETDTDNILQVCLETIQNSCSVLIFCPTKNWCENLAQQIAVAFWKLGRSDTPLGDILRQELNCDLIMELLEQLRRCPVGLDAVLQRTISYGVAFHHAGLTMEERDIVETAFRNVVLRVLVATSTLSSGVNLPARRVIIRTPMFHGKPIDSLIYRQMIGRAGRMGKDLAGESILICQKNDYSIAKELLSAELQPIESCLEGSGKLKRAILEVIASGVATTPEDVKLFTDCTLLVASECTEIKKEIKSLTNPIDEAIEFLSRNEFIRLQKLDEDSSKYVATSLGKACLSSALPPEDGLAIFGELEKARQCFVLETELHLIYLVTPYSACNQWTNLDWMLFLQLWEKLPNSMKRVGELVGVSESYIINGTRNKIQTNSSKLYHKLQIHKRFFIALALQDLVNEVPLSDVAVKFGCNRGMLQSLQQSASTFAGMLTIFSRLLGWSSVEILIAQFQDRLHFGVNRDLLDLMRLPILNGPRARALYNSGIQTLVHLASADVYTIENILYKVAPFESEREREGESGFDAQKRNKIRGIWVTGKEGLTEREAAAMLVEDARRYLQMEMGVTEVKWSRAKEDETNSNTQETKQIEVDENCQTVVLNKEVQNSEASISFELYQSSDSSSPDLDIKSRKEVMDNSKATNLNTSDQSLFGESFELHQQLASCSIKEAELTEELIMAQNSSSEGMNLFSNGNSGDSGLDFDNGSFLENAFVSSFNIESGELQEKIIDNSQTDAVSIIQDTPQSKTYHKLQSCSSHSFVDTDSPSRSYRKRERPLRESTSRDCSIVEGTPFKRRKLQTAAQPKDFTNFTELKIVNVCDNRTLYETFCTELLAQKFISLSFACKKVTENKPVIGANCFETNLHNNISNTNKYVWKDRLMIGLAVCWGSNIVYFISLKDVDAIIEMSSIGFLKDVLANRMLTVRMFDCKEQIRAAKLCCDLDFWCNAEDPKVADWLLDPEAKEKTLQAMTLTYAPEMVSLSQLAGGCKGVGSVGLDLNSSVEPRIRAAIEAVVTWHLCFSFYDILLEQNVKLLEAYKIEMNAVACIARMELNGQGVDIRQLQALADDLKHHIEQLQTRAHTFAGCHFSLASSKEIARVLGMSGIRKVRTNKQALEQNGDPIASIILQWRKLNSTLTKTVFPLLRLAENNRIHGCCIMYTATGRISMHEPNLQNIPKDFEVDYGAEMATVKCRKAFVPKDGNHVLLSADYCQLELRLLAHFSQDAALCSIMKFDKDIFKCVAAKWKNVGESEVDDVLRQWAKQLCYGIIYGIGTKTLAEQLSVYEEEASEFMESFRNKYPSVKKYIEEVVKKCHNTGYVETLAGRKRYLHNINHQNPAIKSQAERQAVNTTIQGSAADIAKTAMILIEERFRNKFRHAKNLPKLVLHLHDELLYEVPKKYLIKTAGILKKSMEEAYKLSIPLPVKLKSGAFWGSMSELRL